MAKRTVQFPMANPKAAGIDIGSKSHWVCAGQGMDHVREYAVFTSDLHEMAHWPKSLGVQTIAMESTGFYWKSLFLLLQDHGFEVILVNAAHVKNVRGKKSDIQDCQWIWQLHSAGLLSASFQPDELTGSLRAYTRHRKGLIDGAARYISKMQKAMVVQNIHLSVVLTDITGKSGQAIIGAILNGERNGRNWQLWPTAVLKLTRQQLSKPLQVIGKTNIFLNSVSLGRCINFITSKLRNVILKLNRSYRYKSNPMVNMIWFMGRKKKAPVEKTTRNLI